VELWRRFRGLQPGEAVILLADFAINTGFFMLVPYISVHVTKSLGLTATIAGTVLAVRMLVQQLVQVFAGPAGDLYGYKRVLVTGLLIRAVGFASFALMGDVTGLMLSAALSGVGGALFGAAERAAYAALNPGPQQASRFALLYTAQSIGTTVGPLIGSFLLDWDFRVLSVVAGTVYLPIVLLVVLYLPNLTSGRERPAPTRAVADILNSVFTVARNRTFVTYCLISAGFWALSGQINISLSLYGAHATGTQTAVKYLLWTSAGLVILFQYKLQAWLEHRLKPSTQWVLGSAIAGLSFLLLIPFPGMFGLEACVVLMTFGGMLLRPVDFTMVTGMAPRDSLASYYGLSAIAVAIGGSAGQFLGGRLLDLAWATNRIWLPWVTFAVIGLLAALGMWRFGDRGQKGIEANGK